MPQTILIVEDDEATQKLLQAITRRYGLESLLARDGAEALEILDAREDLYCIILDLMMPGVDGTAVIERVRRMSARIPVIVCTAAAPRTLPPFDPDIVRAVIAKPFDVDQLMAVVSGFGETR